MGCYFHYVIFTASNFTFPSRVCGDFSSFFPFFEIFALSLAKWRNFVSNGLISGRWQHWYCAAGESPSGAALPVNHVYWTTLNLNKSISFLSPPPRGWRHLSSRYFRNPHLRQSKWDCKMVTPSYLVIASANGGKPTESGAQKLFSTGRKSPTSKVNDGEKWEKMPELRKSGECGPCSAFFSPQQLVAFESSTVHQMKKAKNHSDTKRFSRWVCFRW